MLAMVVALAASAPLAGARAADPQPYAVSIAPTGDAALDSAIRDSSTLLSLRESAPVGPFGLVARARADMDRFLAALHGFGHYNASVAVTVAGRPLADPDLAAALAEVPAGREVPVAVAITPGKLFTLRRVALTGDAPAEAQTWLALKPGAPARAADVLAARARLLDALRARGHALAKVEAPVAMLDAPGEALDVTFPVEAGPRVDLGRIDIRGLGRMHEAFVRRRLLLHPGERYDPAAIERAREDLASIGVFCAVQIDPALALDADGRLPVQVQVSERMLRTVNLGAAYSTDLGGSLTASWTHHNLFGRAESLTLSAAATELGGSAARQPGYDVSAQLTLPDWWRRDQSLSFNLAALRESLDAYDRRAFLAGATLSRKLDPFLTVGVGVQAEQAHILQEGAARDYTLLQLPLTATYDTTRQSLDPTRGLRVAASLTPTESFSRRNATFLIAQASGSAYADVTGRGRSVVAVRGLVGSVQGAGTFDIPPDQRFYAGGGGSVRGYRFQSVGPHFGDGRPVGGTSVDVGSVELRQRIGGSYGAVAFVDAGQVGSTGAPFTGNVDVGAGLGARYYTSFGPIRVDVAVPLVKETGSDSVEVYLGIGQAF